MKLLRWLGGIVLFFWALGLIFRIGGRFIHLLLIIGVIAFIYDLLFNRKNVDKT
ncbi:hypothetical protein CLHOM_34730 [Clostridium homopropionicum DSM 5847]|uniref:Lmo0937 family membrane protein n=1 Tax=Clostridium homopropionicum DSM 5847 TaxID=1121318 RepID=A0A0L6Z6I7_9CLOT|nr:lmo0937 family membrane protein [Clostridium homopropionicum]KOA18571.1 hypothetical protein CLHOM_34730 [Clostridium homopropionicum DSM 5847]SFF64628.1 hypothetical protein SAMN04488501_1017 [Clostridium homopropionicum]